jgi:hypothetical protein
MIHIPQLIHTNEESLPDQPEPPAMGIDQSPDHLTLTIHETTSDLPKAPTNPLNDETNFGSAEGTNQSTE